MAPVLRVTTEAGLAAEQQLLADVCAGKATDGVLFWQATDRALVMPRRMSRLEGFDAASAAVAATGWPVLLRETGGEPVPQSAATINVALVYAAPRSEGDRNRIEAAYERLCQPLCQLLHSLGGEPTVGEVPGAFCDGRYNVNLGGRKWVGTAQRWRQGLSGSRPVVLAHGAMLMGDERQAMVAAVNRFNHVCGLPQRCNAASHIGLWERFPAAQVVQPLAHAYQALLETLRAMPQRVP
ncbi:lipoate--protein ligase family protein [Pseudomonas typographi]|uniref:Lipoate--protein ligase family protein n=1 Tax=Pseudomonas typographi TaxID=2715964 RepID=A0ABR7YV47_9PSED|nr:lipoate--protein ligase family protein [Pseudomonas typographi]MBD1597112.1 lipoate--protein ligase family protein [Pseudomonas typographi]